MHLACQRPSKNAGTWPLALPHESVRLFLEDHRCLLLTTALSMIAMVELAVHKCSLGPSAFTHVMSSSCQPWAQLLFSPEIDLLEYPQRAGSAKMWTRTRTSSIWHTDFCFAPHYLLNKLLESHLSALSRSQGEGSWQVTTMQFAVIFTLDPKLCCLLTVLLRLLKHTPSY